MLKLPKKNVIILKKYVENQKHVGLEKENMRLREEIVRSFIEKLKY